MKFKNLILIFLSLLFWVELSLVVYLGIRLLFFNRLVEVEERAVTPAEVRGKI